MRLHFQSKSTWPITVQKHHVNSEELLVPTRHDPVCINRPSWPWQVSLGVATHGAQELYLSSALELSVHLSAVLCKCCFPVQPQLYLCLAADPTALGTPGHGVTAHPHLEPTLFLRPCPAIAGLCLPLAAFTRPDPDMWIDVLALFWTCFTTWRYGLFEPVYNLQAHPLPCLCASGLGRWPPLLLHAEGFFRCKEWHADLQVSILFQVLSNFCKKGH